MIAIDSSAWIEWLIDSKLAPRVHETLAHLDIVVVPTIVQLEVAKWLMRELSEDYAHEFIAFTEQCDVVPLTTEIALGAAELCRLHKLATADAIIYATALQANADLLTCDAHFRDLPRVVSLEKTA